METRHCGQDKGIFFCPVHSASTPCSLQAFGIRCIYLFIYFPSGTGTCKVLRASYGVSTAAYYRAHARRNSYPDHIHVGLKAHANGRNKCQQLSTLLSVVGQQCCVRLHGPKSLTGFKLYATSGNKCQHCCGSMQTDATSHNIVGPKNVGSVCMGLYKSLAPEVPIQNANYKFGPPVVQMFMTDPTRIRSVPTNLP